MGEGRESIAIVYVWFIFDDSFTVVFQGVVQHLRSSKRRTDGTLIMSSTLFHGVFLCMCVCVAVSVSVSALSLSLSLSLSVSLSLYICVRVSLCLSVSVS